MERNMTSTVPGNVDDYIRQFPPEVRAILDRIRQVVLSAAPGAEETISYQMPAYKLHGALVYFGAFQNHIGFYPPVRADAQLALDVAPYAGPKCNLRFALNQPIPYDLIDRVTRLRVSQNLTKSGRSGKSLSGKSV
jgi:uncharacterized protein YdhG (YjbR/CyaY superfamily)